MSRFWLDLARDSIIDPAGTAPRLAGMTVPQNVLRPLLLLVAVLNGLLFSALLPAEVLALPFLGPIPLAVIAGAVVLANAALMTVTGRILGGTGQFTDLLKMTLWLQLLRLAAQVALTALAFVSAALSSLAGMAAGIWGIYMMVCFVAAAHRFATRWAAIGVMGLSFLGGVVLLAILMSMFGVVPAEVSHV